MEGGIEKGPCPLGLRKPEQTLLDSLHPCFLALSWRSARLYYSHPPDIWGSLGQFDATIGYDVSLKQDFIDRGLEDGIAKTDIGDWRSLEAIVQKVTFLNSAYWQKGHDCRSAVLLWDFIKSLNLENLLKCCFKSLKRESGDIYFNWVGKCNGKMKRKTRIIFFRRFKD